MPEFSEGLAAQEGGGAGEGRNGLRGLATQFFIRQARYLVSFEAEMEATTGQAAVATEALNVQQTHNAYGS